MVTAFNGNTLRGANDLRNRVGLLTVGTTVELTVVRDKEERNIKVTIGNPVQKTVERVQDRPSLAGASFASDIASMTHETQYSRIFRS